MSFLYMVRTRKVRTCLNFLGLRMTKYCHIEIRQIKWKNQVVLKRKAKINKDKNEKGTGKSNPKAPSKKGKIKPPPPSPHTHTHTQNGQENVRDKSKKKNSSGVFDIGNLSSNDILQLREILGVSSVQNEGPSGFDLYDDNTYNLNVEVDNDWPYSDVEIVPSGAPAKPLNAQLRCIIF